MKILVLNSGSSSLKFQLFEMKDLQVLASGIIEQIGEEKSQCTLHYLDGDTPSHIEKLLTIPSHHAAIATMAVLLRETETLTDIHELHGIGHRVVHGGEHFHEPMRIDSKVIHAIEDLIPLAPLHNSANLSGIKVAMEQAPDIPQVAVFDTAFHQTIPKHGFLYALPYSLYTKYRIRRYGFHGTSHHYVAKQAAEFIGKPITSLNIITLHLGNGASVTAIKNGQSVDTSMGMTPLEGLIMGTRSGDLDPAVLFYLARQTGMGIDELDSLLNKDSGLKGICGDNDMRTITERSAQDDPQALLALEMFCYRLKKYIGSYLAVLGVVDCLIFTGGIGENSAQVRQISCQGLEPLGMIIDAEKNTCRTNGIAIINSAESATTILVVPTDEEFEIAAQTMQIISS